VWPKLSKDDAHGHGNKDPAVGPVSRPTEADALGPVEGRGVNLEPEVFEKVGYRTK
jgi:hypothetical protein